MAKGLGKGLSALLGDLDNNNEIKNQIVNISLSELQAGKYQPRVDFISENIDQLADSIAEKGILQPLLVRKLKDNNYEIIAGERRFRAAKQINLNEVPAIVLELSDLESLEVSLIENLQRQDLNPIEEVNGYVRLMEEFNNTQEEVSKLVGKSRSHVANMLRLVKLPQDTQKLIAEGVLSAGHGRQLIGVKNAEEIIKKITQEKLSVREVEDLIRKQKNTKAKVKKRKDPFFIELEDKLTTTIGVNVNFLPNKSGIKGKIVLNYKNEKELNKIISYLENI